MSQAINVPDISDKDLIELTKAIVIRGNVSLTDAESITTREQALDMLEAFADAAANNPLIEIVQRYGQLPPEISIVIPETWDQAQNPPVEPELQTTT